MTSSSVDNYNFRQSPWFSPHVIIKGVNALGQVYGQHLTDKGEFQKPREMFDGAVALVGAYLLHPSNQFFMQPNFQNIAPDVMAVKLAEQKEGPITLEVSQMEIVTMNEHAETKNVAEFLLETKLSSKKSYEDSTIIVCSVNLNIELNSRKIAEELKKFNPKHTVYILGKVEGGEDIWTIFSPWPRLTKLITFSLSETLKSYHLPDSLSLHRGLDRKISYTEPMKVTITSYELFGIDQKKVERYKKSQTSHTSLA